MEALSSKDITVVQVNLLQQEILVVSIYLDSTDSTVWAAGMDEVVEYTDDENQGLIMCLDSNCRSTLFVPEANARGKKIEEAVAGQNLR